MSYKVETIETSIDPTMPDGTYCKIHGNHAPAAYLGNERYGCWHCNPTREIRTWVKETKPPANLPEQDGEIPEWMLG